MRILLLYLITIVGLWSVEVKVVYGDVNLSIHNIINGYFKKGTTFQLIDNQKICLVDKKGDGGVKIIYSPNFVKHLKKVSECETITPLIKAKQKSIAKEFIVNPFEKVKDEPIDSRGIKEVKQDKYTQDIVLSNLKGYLSISTKRWATPLVLRIIYEGKEIYRAEVKKGDKPRFLVPISKLKSGARIEVKNSSLGVIKMDSLIKE